MGARVKWERVRCPLGRSGDQWVATREGGYLGKLARGNGCWILMVPGGALGEWPTPWINDPDETPGQLATAKRLLVRLVDEADAARGRRAS